MSLIIYRYWRIILLVTSEQDYLESNQSSEWCNSDIFSPEPREAFLKRCLQCARQEAEIFESECFLSKVIQNEHSVILILQPPSLQAQGYTNAVCSLSTVSFLFALSLTHEGITEVNV